VALCDRAPAVPPHAVLRAARRTCAALRARTTVTTPTKRRRTRDAPQTHTRHTPGKAQRAGSRLGEAQRAGSASRSVRGGGTGASGSGGSSKKQPLFQPLGKVPTNRREEGESIFTFVMVAGFLLTGARACVACVCACPCVRARCAHRCGGECRSHTPRVPRRGRACACSRVRIRRRNGACLHTPGARRVACRLWCASLRLCVARCWPCSRPHHTHTHTRVHVLHTNRCAVCDHPPLCAWRHLLHQVVAVWGQQDRGHQVRGRLQLQSACACVHVCVCMCVCVFARLCRCAALCAETSCCRQQAAGACRRHPRAPAAACAAHRPAASTSGKPYAPGPRPAAAPESRAAQM
jgi:hypothetical protein